MASLDPARVWTLLDKARSAVDDGLLPACQLALGFEGEIVVDETFGDATADQRFVVFSATKPFVAAAVWQLLGDGRLTLDTRVAEVVPEFGTNGKDVVTVEQVLLHTAGFPRAPLGPPTWDTREGRLAAFGRWRLNWDPGSRFEYHPTSAHWVLAELIERLAGRPYADVIDDHVRTPAGLPRRVLGLPVGEQDGIAELQVVGEPASAAELRALYGVDELDPGEVTDDALLLHNRPDVVALGVPGGGGVMRAADLAAFYQALLHNPGGFLPAGVLADAVGTVRNRFPDPVTGVPANRGLGVVIAGDDGLGGWRGLGRTASARAFGHNGAKGQIAWADPDTGLSFGYCTNGLDRNEIRQARRVVALASLAGACAGD